MRPTSNSFDYEPLTVLIAWGSASFGGVAVIAAILFPFASLYSGYGIEAAIGTNVFLFESAWLIASFFVAMIVVWAGKPILGRFAPPWLVISLLGTLFFILSLWPYAYWQSVKTYELNDPFRSAPPRFDLWMWNAFTSGFFYFLLASMFSLVASLILKQSKEKTGLHLNGE
jgi:hypothetical protein